MNKHLRSIQHPAACLVVLLAIFGADIRTGLAAQDAQAAAKIPQLMELDNTRWKITLRNLAADEPAAEPTAELPAALQGIADRELVAREVIRGGKVVRKISHWKNKTQTDQWWADNFLFIKEPDVAMAFVLQWRLVMMSEKMAILYSPASFPELAWAKPERFIRWEGPPGRSAAIFGIENEQDAGQEDPTAVLLRELGGQQTPPPPSKPATSDSRYARLAWINPLTLRPIAMEAEGVRWEYTFAPGAVPPLSLPDEYREAFAKYLDEINVQTHSKMKLPPKRR